MGCAYKPITPAKAKTEHSESIASMRKSPYHILALGDSYTIGESVEHSERWPTQLVQLLRNDNVAIDEPTTIAKTGWTTDELMQAIEKENPQDTFDLVSLLIGVNNQYRGRSEDEYRHEFKVLLQRSITFAGGKPSHVIVLSIPDWGVTPFAEGRDKVKIAHEIDGFNAINQEEAVRAGVQYVDVTEISRQSVHDPSLIAADGLHPSAKMYAYWARLVHPVALKVLR